MNTMSNHDGENTVNPGVTKVKSCRLEDLAEKSSQRGSTANYITATQALRDDLIDFMKANFEEMQILINNLKEEVRESKARESELIR